jgi:hypothetical protein
MRGKKMASVKLSDFGKGYNKAIEHILKIILFHSELPKRNLEHIIKDIKKLKLEGE